MKIVSSLKWLPLRAQRCKAVYQRFLLPKSSQPTLSTNYSIQTPSNPFTNPDRPQNQAKINLSREDFPLQVTLSAKRHQNLGRFYSGNNPSVTTILDATRPKSELYALLNWRRGLIKELGEGGYNDKVTKIKNRGTTFHQAIKQFLSTGTKPTLQNSNFGHWESVQHVLTSIDRIIALESVVVHPRLQYAGTLDGIISYQGKLCVIDWKTSERKRIELKDCFSYPHQIVAYAGAVNYDINYQPMQIDKGLLVLAYPDGSPADTIWMSPDNCEHYWKEWLDRLQLYNQTISFNTSWHSNQGNRMRDLAQYVDGMPSEKSVILQESVMSVAETLEQQEFENSEEIHTDIAEWCESVIDVFQDDPSTCEYDEKDNC